jgi:hypothetical protein
MIHTAMLFELRRISCHSEVLQRGRTAQKDEFYRIGVVTLVGLEWSSTSDEERDLTLL